MDVATQLDEVIELFGRLGIEVRTARLGGGGGDMCSLRGRRMYVVDLDADVATRCSRIIHALQDLSDVDQLYLPPWLREALDRRKC